jgi:release factor glutamine methyltransferase
VLARRGTALDAIRRVREVTRRQPYQPRMSRQDAERIRAWHEKAYEAMSQREISTVGYLGRTFSVPSQVFPPTPMSELLGKAVLDEVRAPDRVLDMGTGCGVNAILAASRSMDVVGVDINPYAIECARQNAAANGVGPRIEFFQSDVFDRVHGSFDLIVFDPPFRWFAPRDHLEASIADENYSALTRFMEQAQSRLRPGGRMLMFFGSSGDLDYLLSLIDRCGFARDVVAERSLVKDDSTVRYYVFRLTPVV